MKIGRNDPCHCGSGKKYQKCCLEKDQAAWGQAAATAAATSKHDSGKDEPSQNAGEESDAVEEESAVEPVELAQRTEVAEEAEPPPAREYPRPDEELPDLPPAQNQSIEAWWAKADPWFRAMDPDAMLRLVETALSEFPDLFVYLGLHSEFIFELGAELGRRGRMPEYIALLKRLRRDQRQMYSFCYGAYDSDVIAELVLTGQVAEIPAYLDLFKEYPDAEPDYCRQTCTLLAWRGHSEALYLLCEAVAAPMLTSVDVIDGSFALDWLLRREYIRFLEGADHSPSTVDQAVDDLRRLGDRIQLPVQPNASWFSDGLKASLEPPPVETPGPLDKDRRRRLAWNFVWHLRHVRRVPCLQGFLLSDLLLDYLSWCRRQRVPWSRFKRQDVEAFVVDRSKILLACNGVLVLAAIQSLVWFADYLLMAEVLSGPAVARVKEDGRRIFEAGRQAVDSTDPAYRFCPTFEQLIANPAG